MSSPFGKTSSGRRMVASLRRLRPREKSGKVSANFRKILQVFGKSEVEALPKSLELCTLLRP